MGAGAGAAREPGSCVCFSDNFACRQRASSLASISLSSCSAMSANVPGLGGGDWAICGTTDTSQRPESGEGGGTVSGEQVARWLGG